MSSRQRPEQGARYERSERIEYSETVYWAAERAGLSVRIVRHCITLGLIEEPLGDSELADLRRIRRLHELGVNLAGIQVILHMRRQMDRMLAEMRRADVETIDLAERLLPYKREGE